MPLDTFATAVDASAYGYALPASAAAGLLSRATQALRDEAGYPITTTTSTLQLQAGDSRLKLPTPLISAVSALSLVNIDSTVTALTAGTDWQWRTGQVICLLDDGVLLAEDRYGGLFQVTYTHGLAAAPPALIRLTCAVAARLAATPVTALTGITSETTGSVSWSAAGSRAPVDGLTESECRQLTRAVPVRRAWQVPL